MGVLSRVTPWWAQYIARCGEWYIEEQPPLHGGILEGPRKVTLMFIS